MSFKAKRLVLNAELEIEGNLEQIFPLLCPTKEYDWIPGWNCKILYSESGFAEDNCIFRTDFPSEGEVTWVVTCYRPNERIEFTLFGGNFINRYNISLSSISGGRAIMRTEQIYTGLNEQGNEFIRGLSGEAFAREMNALEQMLNHYLKTGKMLS